MAVVGYVRAVGADQRAAAGEIEALRAAGADLVVVDQAEPREGQAPLSAAVTASLQPGDTFLVVGLDRITGSVPALVEVMTELDARGVHLRSLSDPVIDTSGEHGASVVAFAALLRRLHRGRPEGQAAVQRGSVGPPRPRAGRPSVMSAERVAAARALRDAGQSLSAIGEALGVSASSVARALAREDENANRSSHGNGPGARLTASVR